MNIAYVTLVPLAQATAPAHHVLATCEALRELGHSVEVTYPGPKVTTEVAGRCFDVQAVLWQPNIPIGWRVPPAHLLFGLARRDWKRFDLMYLRVSSFRGLAHALGRVGIPKVLEVNGLELVEQPRFVELGRAVDLVLTDSEPQRERVVERVRPVEPMVRIHPGAALDPAVFQPRSREQCKRELGMPKDRDLILHVSGFWPHHDFATIEQGYRRLVQERDGLPPALVLVGDGVQRREVESRMADLVAGGQVRFTGTVERARLAAYIGAADVCLNLLTADKLQEGNIRGLKIYDYLGCARPTIQAVNFGEPIDTWSREALCLIPPEDPRALASAIGSVLDEQAQWDKRAVWGREYLLRNHTWKAATNVTLGHIEELLRENSNKEQISQ